MWSKNLFSKLNWKQIKNIYSLKIAFYIKKTLHKGALIKCFSIILKNAFYHLLLVFIIICWLFLD